MTISAIPRESRSKTDRAIVSFRLDGDPGALPTPISTGIPLPMGLIRDPSRLRLTATSSDGESRRELPAQFESLAHWPDGTLRAVRLDFTTPTDLASCQYNLTESNSALISESNTPEFDLRLEQNRLVATLGGYGDIELAAPLTLTNGTVKYPRWDRIDWLARGPIRWTAELTGRFDIRHSPKITIHITRHSGSLSICLDVVICNPRRAVHRGGLWDLGDPNTFYFRSFEIIARRGGSHNILVTLNPADQVRESKNRAAIYQDSSGGENWNSINHVNHAGVVPCRFRGYQYQDDNTPSETGRRATPTFVLNGSQPLSLTLPHFWQQFPKSLAAISGEIRVGLFPAEWDDDHELQPGEQKTHSIWLSALGDPRSLNFVHHPPLPILPAAWYEQCGLFEAFPVDPARDSRRLCDYISTAIDPTDGLAARREAIDEYGWRNWGELWADHEQPDDSRDTPVVSHYNNQYDVLEGTLRQYARSGDRAWWELAAPLARHCVDIDLYHTDDDRAVYNHGFFWHTDHYQSAHTAAHRTYSRENAKGRPIYGGGPSSSHCYSTGFLHLYYLTGDPAYRRAVLELADWLIAMEDGASTEFSMMDDGPTGISTISAEPWYHGPGRGPANTLNTLVDAWELTGESRYRDHAEMIIRRVVTPGENIDSLELLDVERRWFYIMFLLALAKYLDAKQIANENDAAYGYAIAVARDYAAWMCERERPYFQHPEQLEYPTETWGAQDIRKANAMRRLARYCEPPLAQRVLERATELADRGWRDLLRFDSRSTLRPTAIVLIEGLRDEFFRVFAEPLPSTATHTPKRRATREPFTIQRERARTRLRSPAGVIATISRLGSPRHWRNLSRALRARL